MRGARVLKAEDPFIPHITPKQGEIWGTQVPRYFYSPGLFVRDPVSRGARVKLRCGEVSASETWAALLIGASRRAAEVNPETLRRISTASR